MNNNRTMTTYTPTIQVSSVSDRLRAWVRLKGISAIGVLSLVISIVQTPWYMGGVYLGLPHFGGSAIGAWQHHGQVVLMFLPSIVAMVTGTFAILFARQSWGKSCGGSAFMVVAFYAFSGVCVAGKLPVVVRWFLHLF